MEMSSFDDRASTGRGFDWVAPCGRRYVVRWLSGLLVCCALSTGCQRLPVSSLEGQLALMPEASREHVYVYLVEPPGDIFHRGRIPELARRLHRSGYAQAEYFAVLQDGSGKKLAERVRLARENDPEARIMLVGWSGGSKTIFKALKALEPDGVVVDRVVYIDDDWLKSKSRQKDGHPENVTRTVLIYRHENPPPQGIPNAVLHVAADRKHRTVATNPSVYNVLLTEVRDLTIAPATGSQLSRQNNPYGVRISSFPKRMRNELKDYDDVVKD